jgi:uncharacterized protein
MMILEALRRRWIRCTSIVILLALLYLPLQIPFRVLLLAGAALIWSFLEAGDLRPLGLGRHAVKATLIWAVALFALITTAGHLVQEFLYYVLDQKPDLSGYGALVGNAPAALRLLSFALTSAAIGEEILFRGFLLHQLSEVLGHGKRARWLAVLLAGAAFGLGHWIQGPLGIIQTGLVGVIFGWAWFRSGRNLWALILAHAMTDTFGIAMLYFGWAA